MIHLFNISDNFSIQYISTINISITYSLLNITRYSASESLLQFNSNNINNIFIENNNPIFLLLNTKNILELELNINHNFNELESTYDETLYRLYNIHTKQYFNDQIVNSILSLEVNENLFE
jgi:hypothetical protein